MHTQDSCVATKALIPQQEACSLSVIRIRNHICIGIMQDWFTGKITQNIQFFFFLFPNTIIVILHI